MRELLDYQEYSKCIDTKTLIFESLQLSIRFDKQKGSYLHGFTFYLIIVFQFLPYEYTHIYSYRYRRMNR